MKKILPICLALVLAGSASAAVTLNFATTTDGFTNVSWNTANGGPAWSANYGGSLAITVNTAGWTNPVALLNLTGTPALAAEYSNALLYGGTVTFDYILSRADVTGYNEGSPPGWFELVAIGNSDAATGGGYDQNVLGGALGTGGGIPVGPTTRTVSLGIGTGAPAADMNLTYGTGSGWNEFMIGMNSQGSSFTAATIYIDNFTLTANPVPEPTAAGLGLLALGSLALRRRRQA